MTIESPTSCNISLSAVGHAVPYLVETFNDDESELAFCTHTHAVAIAYSVMLATTNVSPHLSDAQCSLIIYESIHEAMTKLNTDDDVIVIRFGEQTTKEYF